MMSLLWMILIGGIAGWIAGNVMRGGGFGILVNIALGIVGSFVGGALFWIIGLKGFGLIGSLLVSTVGAIVVLAVAGAVNQKRL